MIEMLESLGGKRWQGGSNDRVYLPVQLCCNLIGLAVTRYNSGNVSSATLEGEKISNGTATAMLSSLDGSYYNVLTDKFFTCHGVAEAARARLA